MLKSDHFKVKEYEEKKYNAVFFPFTHLYSIEWKMGQLAKIINQKVEKQL